MTAASRRDEGSTSDEPHTLLLTFPIVLIFVLFVLLSSRRTGRSDARAVSTSWECHLDREVRRYRDGRARMPFDPRGRKRQLLRIGSAAWGAGLSALMLGNARRHARGWLLRAACDYRAGSEFAAPGAWRHFPLRRLQDGAWPPRRVSPPPGQRAASRCHARHQHPARACANSPGSWR